MWRGLGGFWSFAEDLLDEMCMLQCVLRGAESLKWCMVNGAW